MVVEWGEGIRWVGGIVQWTITQGAVGELVTGGLVGGLRGDGVLGIDIVDGAHCWCRELRTWTLDGDGDAFVLFISGGLVGHGDGLECCVGL